MLGNFRLENKLLSVAIHWLIATRCTDEQLKTQQGELGGWEGLQVPTGGEIWVENRVESGFQKPEISALDEVIVSSVQPSANATYFGEHTSFYSHRPNINL